MSRTGRGVATLIPGIGSCTFASGGERRFAERLEQKLEDDYLCWYDVALAPANGHPDFIVFHPRRGLLVLEVKDWPHAQGLRRGRLGCNASPRFRAAQGPAFPLP